MLQVSRATTPRFRIGYRPQKNRGYREVQETRSLTLSGTRQEENAVRGPPLGQRT